MPKPSRLTAAAFAIFAAAALLVGCEGAAESSSLTPTREAVEKSSSNHDSARQSVRKPKRNKAKNSTNAAVPVQEANSWIMPDLRGRDLQTAQDTIQSVTRDGVWYTESHDVSGEDRGQWLDRGWQVCTQNIAPGDRITSDSRVDFGVVRESERCP